MTYIHMYDVFWVRNPRSKLYISLAPPTQRGTHIPIFLCKGSACVSNSDWTGDIRTTVLHQFMMIWSRDTRKTIGILFNLTRLSNRAGMVPYIDFIKQHKQMLSMANIHMYDVFWVRNPWFKLNISLTLFTWSDTASGTEKKNMPNRILSQCILVLIYWYHAT